MKIAFRTDASLQIGSGHVMRCLTLADALRAKGAQCHFISRAQPGHLMDVIHQRGYMTNSLVASVHQSQAALKNIAYRAQEQHPNQAHEPTHAPWLRSTWQLNAQETAAVLATLQPDWLNTDHYALDHRWEAALQPHCRKLMVLDDLADRSHCCDAMRDQNLGESLTTRYLRRVPEQCICILGPQYALVRPDFSAQRQVSLARRIRPVGYGSPTAVIPTSRRTISLVS